MRMSAGSDCFASGNRLKSEWKVLEWHLVGDVEVDSKKGAEYRGMGDTMCDGSSSSGQLESKESGERGMYVE